MKPESLAYIGKMVKERSGLVLTADKGYLVESRLMPLARARNLAGIDDLVERLKTMREPALADEITDAMTTNESFFFRDTKPFDQFRDVVMPQLLISRAAHKTIRIWSAACSSGQEPYSLAMILREMGPKVAGWRFDIVATDISNEILTKAKAGVYTQFEVQRGLPIQMLVKYFKQDGDKWLVDPSIKSQVQFRYFNLLQDPTSLGRFDIVFCRNVLIYFDQPTKTKVLDMMRPVMATDGVLYLGGAETVMGVSDKFTPMPGQRGLYTIVSSDQRNALPAAS